MVSPTPRGERTRDEILAAATEVVLESGPTDFSLREVARRSKLAPSALYNHFANRETLIVALAQRALGGLQTYLAAAPESDDPTERLRELGRAYLAFARERPHEYRLIFECLENPPTSWEAYLSVAEPFLLIVDACTRGLESGVFVDRAGAGAGGMAYAMWALCHGHASLTARNLSNVEGDFDALASAGIEALLAGYRKEC
jgi:AcrR family transcriptional regulator